MAARWNLRKNVGRGKRRITSEKLGGHNSKRKLGVSDSAFVITAKVPEEEAAERYEKESHVFLLLPLNSRDAQFLLLNRSSREAGGDLQTMGMQYVIITGVLVVINWPLCESMLLRKAKREDAQRTITVKAFVLPSSACTCIALL
ncbi:hypothetical protein Bca52824_023932 [Brassica carinata]|uniref:Uncharacterized protein n=1 Tax=Brassica carinata TaxID=52824 RepID=A0A8X7VK58_BRACI|nr:hypothetical protein Bca52824_023932 [Brassica carinata]